MMQQSVQPITSLPEYSRLVFDAISNDEPLQDVSTVTIKGAFMQEVEQQAIDNLLRRGKKLSKHNVSNEIESVISSGTIFVQESVNRSRDGISVVVDTENIDDVAIERVFNLINSAIDQLKDSCGVINFGTPRTYSNTTDISWLRYY